MTRGLLTTIIGIGGAISLGVAGNLAHGWLTGAWRTSVKKLKHLKPDENENIERAVARSSVEATLFCVERALGFENPKPIRTRLKAIRSGCRARLRRLSRDFRPVEIDHKRIIKIEGNEQYGALICQREIDSIESFYGELTDEIRVQFRKEWFELLVRQYLFQIKYDDPVEHVVLLKKVDEVEGKIDEVLDQVDGLRSYEIAPVWKHFLALSAQWKEIKPPSPGIDTQSREEIDLRQKHGLISLEEQIGFGYANLRWAVEVAAAQDADGVIDGAIGLNRLSRSHLPVGEPDVLLLARDVARKNHFPGQERCVAELGSELCNAAKAGQEDVMLRLLESGVSADVSDPLGYTALHHAASTGRRSTVSLLLEKRASVDSLDRYHRTPLFVACTYGRTEVVERLLEERADPTIEEAGGLTPLDLAVVSNRRSILEAFITSGVSMNQLNSRGMSPLCLAASVGDIAMVELLLAKGADPNFPAQPSPKPLMIAALRGKKDIVETLCRAGSPVDALDTRGMSALMCACWLGRTEIVEVLIQHHADVNLETPSGWSALMFSAAFESQQGDEALRLVQWLVAAGANRAPNATGSVAARLATLCGRADHESAQSPAENRGAPGGTI